MEEKPAKIQIVPYTDKELKKKDKEVPAYIVPVNPEQYTLNYKIKYDVKPGSGNHGVEEKFIASMPEELKLDFIIDGTGTIYGYKYSDDSKKSVTDQLQHFKSVVYDMAGKIHQPRLLKIIGLGISQKGNGDVTFDGILSELQVNFTLFNPNGEPLRAKISAKFLDYRETKRRVLEEQKESPDLTHIYSVAEADKLPLISYETYDDPAYYMEVAKVNKLTNFRKLSVGQKLTLPPIEKAQK